MKSNLISSWYEKSDIHKGYFDLIELVKEGSEFYLIRNSFKGDVIEKIELNPHNIPQYLDKYLN
jgi:hypothetical protein